ncbi:MAG: hypothetical protein Q7R52_03865 [archaeon]|nr:hypothetical protein [archaeon]
MTKRLPYIVLASAITLGSIGCSPDSEKVIYDGYTSLGKTSVIEINKPGRIRNRKIDRKIIITKADTTWTLGDMFSNGLWNSSGDYVIQEIYNGKNTLYSRDYICKGPGDFSKPRLEGYTPNWIKRKFNDMYQKVLSESADSLKVQKANH